MKWFFAVAGFLILSSHCVQAEDNAKSCAAVEDAGARLLCYDGIFREKRVVGAPSGFDNTKWQFSARKSQIDDSETRTLSLLSEDDFPAKFRGREKATLLLRCDEKVTSLFFIIGDHFLADIQGYGEITYRVDDKKAAKRNFEVSTDNKALGLWSGPTAVPVVKQMLGGKRLVIRVTPFNESPLTTTFDITGIDEAIKPVREACKW